MATASAPCSPSRPPNWLKLPGQRNNFNPPPPSWPAHWVLAPNFSSQTSNSSSSPDLHHDHTDADVSPESLDNEDDAFDTVVPKIEEVDEQSLYDLKIDAKPVLVENPSPISQTSSLPDTGPRKRGRPRKHPIVEQKKSTHARSKTGCGTCRRRKKKCDETRPVCQNCEKNNVVCDGYEPKQPWRSGKQKALVTRRPSVPQPLPPMVPGVETAVDEHFYIYFSDTVTKSLSMISEGYNPFQQEILPMAHQSVGLMHSLLYLSSSSLLAKNPAPNREWEDRNAHHRGQAISLLKQDITTLYENPNAPVAVFEPSVAHALILCLQTVCAGDLDGSYKSHLIAMKHLLTSRKEFPNERLRQLILEFVVYHDYSSAITTVENPLNEQSLALMEDFRLPAYMIQPQAGTLLGVLDRLFSFISRIRNLRDQIRANNGRFWEGHFMTEAWKIQHELDAWRPQYPEDSPRYAPSMLYRICTFIYLQRTIKPSRPCTEIKRAVDEGLEYLTKLPWDTDDISTQSILLMPLFLLGCAAFEPEQRPPISEAFERLREWSGFGNIQYAHIVVKEMWELMDQGREAETWDWESLMEKKGWRFLVT